MNPTDATRRRASRSSPNTLSAISARTPESMWSSRCEIGWPTLTATGRAARRPRMSATSAYANMNRREASISRFGRAKGDLFRAQLQINY